MWKRTLYVVLNDLWCGNWLKIVLCNGLGCGTVLKKWFTFALERGNGLKILF